MLVIIGWLGPWIGLGWYSRAGEVWRNKRVGIGRRTRWRYIFEHYIVVTNAVLFRLSCVLAGASAIAIYVAMNDPFTVAF